MAIETYPVGANSGFSEESAIDSEKDRLLSSLGDRMQNFIVDPFTGGDFDITSSGASLDVDIAAGDAFMGGHLVVNDATITLTLDASSTNEIFLVVRDGVSGNAEVTFTSDASTPTGQYVEKIWEADTDTSGVTSTEDFRPYIPFDNGDATEDSITGQKQGTSGTIPVDSVGIQSVSVTFTHPYRNTLDQVIPTLNTLTDTSVNFGWIRVTNRTVDGFDIEARITQSGSSGTTADFDWIAEGT